MIETKPPLLNSAVADLVEGPLFRAKKRQRKASIHTPFPPKGKRLDLGTEPPRVKEEMSARLLALAKFLLLLACSNSR